MENFELAFQVPQGINISSSCVMRNLDELDDEDKCSVIYEIARIETIISRLAEP